MVKNLMFGIAIFISASLLLSACGSQATQPATQPSAEAAPQNTTQPQPESLAYPSPVAQQPVEEASPYPQPASAGSPAAGNALDSLLAAMQGAGLNVSTGGEISQPYFSVPGKVLVLNGEELQVYVFPAPEAAEADAGSISADGSLVGTNTVDWISTPHFFRSGNLVVLYVGENQNILQALQSLLGSQFAGG